jgi:hypothetical protein
VVVIHEMHELGITPIFGSEMAIEPKVAA